MILFICVCPPVVPRFHSERELPAFVLSASGSTPKDKCDFLCLRPFRAPQNGLANALYLQPAYKAADAFFKANKIKNRGINIDIVKRIPHQAGLAGGSADGAAVLVALNELLGTKLSDDELCDIGVKIGADVPFCIKGGTLLAQGIGDVLHKVKPLRKCFILIAKPDYGVNTGKAYALFDSNGKIHTPDKFGMLCAMQNRDLNEICAKMENVFEQFIEVPNKVDIKEVMRNNGALGVCMSGSGPTVFGIFDEKEKAEKAGDELAAYAKDIAVTTPVNKGCKIIK